MHAESERSNNLAPMLRAIATGASDCQRHSCPTGYVDPVLKTNFGTVALLPQRHLSIYRWNRHRRRGCTVTLTPVGGQASLTWVFA